MARKLSDLPDAIEPRDDVSPDECRICGELVPYCTCDKYEPDLPDADEPPRYWHGAREAWV